MNRAVANLIFLVAASGATFVLWERALPHFFATDKHNKSIAAATLALDDMMPLSIGDQQISETVYNHGGEVGVGRRYASSEPRSRTQLAFEALSSRLTTVDGSRDAKEASAFCHGDLQVGIDYLDGDSGYFVYAVEAAAAVQPIKCRQ